MFLSKGWDQKRFQSQPFITRCTARITNKKKYSFFKTFGKSSKLLPQESGHDTTIREIISCSCWASDVFHSFTKLLRMLDKWDCIISPTIWLSLSLWLSKNWVNSESQHHRISRHREAVRTHHLTEFVSQISLLFYVLVRCFFFLLLFFFFPVLGWFLFCNYGFCVELAEAKLDLYLYGWLKVGKGFTEILSTLSPQNLFVSTEINSIESLWFSKNVSLLNQTRHFSGVQIWEKRFSVKSWLWLVSILCTSSVIVFFSSEFSLW